MRTSEMSKRCSTVLLFIVVAIAVPRDSVARGEVRPLMISGALAKAASRYSLRAYESCNPKNSVQGLLFVPKLAGNESLPMVIYIPGNGEIGDFLSTSTARTPATGGISTMRATIPNMAWMSDRSSASQSL